MILATLNETDNLYRFLVFLHVLAAIVGFGSTFVYPLLGNYASKHPGLEGMGISDATLFAAHKVTNPPIYAVGVLGIILAAVGPYGFDETWVSVAMLLYIGALVFSHLVHQPNLKRMNALVHELVAMGPPPGAGEGGPPPGGPPPQVVELEQRGKAAARNGGILHLLFAILLLLMVFGARGTFA